MARRATPHFESSPSKPTVSITQSMATYTTSPRRLQVKVEIALCVGPANSATSTRNIRRHGVFLDA